MSDIEYEKKRSFRALWWIAAAIVLIVLVAGAALYFWGTLAYSTQTQHQVFTRPVTAVTIDADAADIIVTAGPAGQVSVERTLQTSKGWQPVITETWTGSSLRVTVNCPSSFFGRKCAIRYAIAVPASTVVDVRADSGSVSAKGLTARTSLSASSGDLTATDLAGPLTLRADSGNLTGSGLTSTNVTANADSGNISLTFAAAPKAVDVSADSGDVRVAVPRTGTPDDSYTVQASVDSGTRTVSVRTPSSTGRTINAKADSGDVTVTYQT
jgi:hypothetical protein